MDSNSQYLTAEDLWKNLEMVHTTTIVQLRQHLFNTDLNRYDIAYIHVGVNDIDTMDGTSVADDLINIVEKMRHLYPALKIILSEVTPRSQYRDDHVQCCNAKLRATLGKKDNITLGFHSNLRDPSWAFHKDDKHFAQISISKFAANIKVALRKSIGISTNKFNKSGRKRDSNNNDNRNSYKPNNNKNFNNRSSGNNSVEELKNFLIKSLQNYKG